MMPLGATRPAAEVKYLYHVTDRYNYRAVIAVVSLNREVGQSTQPVRSASLAAARVPSMCLL